MSENAAAPSRGRRASLKSMAGGAPDQRNALNVMVTTELALHSSYELRANTMKAKVEAGENTMSRTSMMKTVSMLGAAMAVSLALANAASAFTVKESRTTTNDGLGDRVTKLSRTTTDDLGDRVTKSRTTSDNGFSHCVTLRRTASDAVGDRNSRSVRSCSPDF